MNQIIKNNKRLSLAIHACTTIFSLTATGTLMQTFLATLGVEVHLIHIHTTLIQAANVATLLICSKLANTSKLIRNCALTGAPSALLFLCYLPLCFRSSLPQTAFVFLVLISVFHAVVMSIRTIYNYSIPYLLYPADDYGTFSAVIGILSGLVSLCMGFVISYLTQRIPFATLMSCAFLLSMLLELLVLVLTLLQKSILKTEELTTAARTGNSLSLGKLWTHPTFLPLIIPNLLRGFAYGTTSVLATLAFDIGYDETVTTAMVSIQSLTTLFSCAVIGLLLKHMSGKIPVFAGSLSFLLLPLLFSGNQWIFLSVYAIVLFGKTLVDYGVPAYLRHVVPFEIAGPYNVWRLMLHNGGSLLATSLAAVLDAKVLILITVIFSVISGIGFLTAKVSK